MREQAQPWIPRAATISAAAGVGLGVSAGWLLLFCFFCCFCVDAGSASSLPQAEKRELEREKTKEEKKGLK
jgi:hypothetical protein